MSDDANYEAAKRRALTRKPSSNLMAVIWHGRRRTTDLCSPSSTLHDLARRFSLIFLEFMLNLLLGSFVIADSGS